MNYFYLITTIPDVKNVTNQHVTPRYRNVTKNKKIRFFMVIILKLIRNLFNLILQLRNFKFYALRAFVRDKLTMYKCVDSI